MSIAASSAWAAGQGFYNAFSVDSSQQGQVQTIQFAYKISSGAANCNFSNSSTSTFAVGIYDVTNSVWVQVSPTQWNAMSGPSGIAKLSFQASSNSTSYDLLVFAQNASSGAVTMLVDSFLVGPQVNPGYSFVGTDPVAYTPAFTGLGTVTSIAVNYMRQGKNLIVYGNFTTGTTTSTTAQITLPAGLTIDSSIAATQSVVGEVVRNTGVSFKACVIAEGGNNFVNLSNQLNSANAWTAVGGSTALGNSEAEYIYFTVPILGWSSQSQAVSQYDGRAVAASYYISSNYSATGGSQINFDSKEFDSHGAINTGAGWNFLAPVTGIYAVTVTASLTSSTTNLRLWKNGAAYKTFGSIETSYIQPSTVLVQMNAGDYIDIRPISSVTIAGGALNTQNGSNININLLSGSQQILANQRIFAQYYASTSTSLTSGQYINFDTKIIDTTGSVTTGSNWNFTAPVSGDYLVAAAADSSSGSTDAIIAINGTQTYYLFNIPTSKTGNGSYIVNLKAGDKLQIAVNGSVTIGSGGTAPYQVSIAIKQI